MNSQRNQGSAVGLELWTPDASRREILQVMPAPGWAAYCWQAETSEYSRLPLVGWALVRETLGNDVVTKVMGLCAMGEQTGKRVQVEPIFYADELVNFRHYGVMEA